MKNCKNIITLIKNDSYARIMIELILGTLLFNINWIVGITFVAVITAEIIFTSAENCLFTFLFLSFFDEVIQFEKIGGSISRIVMVVIFIKLSINIIKNKRHPNKYQIGIIVFFLISLIVSIINLKSINLSVLVILFNIVLFVLFSIAIKFENKIESEKFIEKLLFTIVIAVLNSIVYGIITNNVMKEIEGEAIAYRFKGTYEPNFMCMYINLAILCILFIKDSITLKLFYYVTISMLILANILTVSITGLVTFGISIMAYFIIKRKTIKENLKSIVIIIVLVVAFFALFKVLNIFINSKTENNIEQTKVEDSPNLITITNGAKDNNTNQTINIVENSESQQLDTGIKVRLSFLSDILKNGDLDRLTSGRIPLIRTFTQSSFDRPIFNILLGNDPTTKQIFSNYFYRDKYSHNSYIDILYNFGIIGFIAVGIYIYIIVNRNLFIGFEMNENKYKTAIKLIRVMLLIYAITLSLYTKRMVLVFFLL